LVDLDLKPAFFLPKVMVFKNDSWQFRFMIRTVSSQEIAHFQYPAYDVLPMEVDRINRIMELKSAMATTNTEHESIGIVVQLSNGDEVEIVSDLIDVEDDVIEVKGAHLIPIRAILRVQV
jgi:hypothetical protein